MLKIGSGCKALPLTREKKSLKSVLTIVVHGWFKESQLLKVK